MWDDFSSTLILNRMRADSILDVKEIFFFFSVKRKDLHFFDRY